MNQEESAHRGRPPSLCWEDGVKEDELELTKNSHQLCGENDILKFYKIEQIEMGRICHTSG